MVRIFEHGEIKGDSEEDMLKHIQSLTERAENVVLFDPEGDQEQELTHYWLLFKDHVKTAYLGTPESFEQWKISEVN